MNIDDALTVIALCVGSAGVGSLIHLGIQKMRLTTYRQLAAEMIRAADSEIEKKQQAYLLDSKTQEFALQKELEKRSQQERKKLSQEEERLKGREDKLEQRMTLVEKKMSELERKEASLAALQQKIDLLAKDTEAKEKTLIDKLEKISGISAGDAKEQLLAKMNDELKHDVAVMIRKSIADAQENAEREASKIIVTAIQRLAVPCVNETTINTVSLPSEELKDASSEEKGAIYVPWNAPQE